MNLELLGKYLAKSTFKFNNVSSLIYIISFLQNHLVRIIQR